MDMKKWIKGCIGLIGLCCSLSVNAQTMPAGYEDQLVLAETRDFILCNAEGKQFKTALSNESDAKVFQDGTYELDLGDGEQVFKNLRKSDFPKNIVYNRQGPFDLKFSALTSAGVRVSRIYKVSTLVRPQIDIQPATTEVQCVGQELKYFVNVYDANTKGTVYTIDYGDGTAPDVLTNEELRQKGGAVTHVYENSYCNIPGHDDSKPFYVVSATAENECKYTSNKAFQEKVVTPLHAAFTFDQWDGKNCSYDPVRLKNITSGGTDIDCSTAQIYWEWDFGNGTTSNAFQPSITYEQAKDYQITLRATSDYTCAGDTATVSLLIIERVKVDFEMDRDSICVNTTLLFTNKTRGQEIQGYDWSVVSLDGFASPEITGGPHATHPKITFTHYGRYRVSLETRNGCSSDTKDTVITVQQDPDIRMFQLPATLCPPRLDMTGKVGYFWNGNKAEPLWTVTRKSTGEVVADVYAGGTGPESEYPQFNFTVPGDYHIRVEVKGVGCGGTTLMKEGDLKVYDPVILPKIVTTPTNICEGAQVAFTSTSTGENLQYTWSYSPASNVSFVSGKNEHSSDPILAFKKFGDYQVKLHLEAACTSWDTTFHIHVSKEPNIFYFDLPAAICPNDVIDFREKIIYQFYNNDEKAEWTITPSTGIEFLEGTGLTSAYPKIRFTEPAINYQFKVKVQPVGCTTEGVVQEMTKQVRVRASAMSLAVSATDTVICEGEKVDFAMSARSEEGDPLVFNWSVTPMDGTTDFGFIGHQTSVANITFNHWGTYRVRAEASGYCGTLDSTIQVRIKKDPEVRLKDTTGMCPEVLDMQNYVSYQWYNNTPKVKWTITPSTADTPADGFEYREGDQHTLYPKFFFKSKGLYDLKIELETADCNGNFLKAVKEYQIYDTTITVDMGPDRTDICEGEKVYVRNVNTGVGIQHHWTITGPEGGFSYEEHTGAESAAPVLLFSKYGEYRLHVDITGTCNRKEREYTIVVRGVPDISIVPRMAAICAGVDSVELSDYLTYTDARNSTLTYAWEVSPAHGVEYMPGYEADKAFPRIVFQDNEHYEVTLKVSSECVATQQTFVTEIDVIRATLKAEFHIPAEGCTEDLQIVPDNTSAGDSLDWKWEVVPAAGWTLKAGTALTDRMPGVVITEPGSYTFTLKATNICGTDQAVATLRSYGVPEVAFGNMADICETYQLNMADTITITEHNDAIRQAEWTISPEVTYRSGTTAASVFPEIELKAGEYRIRAEFRNGCVTPAVAEFTVKVDTFISVQPLPDDTLCLFAPSLTLQAEPSGGNWTFGGPEEMIEHGGVEWMFHPLFSGEYELLYTRAHKSCTAMGAKRIKVHPLPVVEAGDDLFMCQNDSPQTLVAQPEGGWWEGAGVVTPVFTPVLAGEVKLMYYYTDEHQCTNRDSVRMTVHPLPDTAFLAERQYCRGMEAEFIPRPDEKQYIWNYGDLTEPDTVATGNGKHIYEHHGYYSVVLVAESVYGCRDTSAPWQVEIVNDAPPAVFTLDKHADCGPEVDIQITLVAEDYADHNLQFAWDYGNEQTSALLAPESPQRYQAGLWDTTYYIRFKVSNICNETNRVDSVVIGSLPKADLFFRHKWNCSPLNLRVLNASTGDGNRYTWYMGDGTVVADEYEPQEHLYETESGTKVFEVSLVAQNVCGRDSVMKPLTVLAQSLEAFFETPKNDVCVGEEICFTNRTTDTAFYVTYKYWDFGDEVRDTSWNACHVYKEAGLYDVFLYVDNGCGFDTISDRLRVWALPRLAIHAGEAVCDRDSFHFSFETDQELQQWRWNFGDETNSRELAPDYAYHQPGRYPVTLEVIAQNIALCKTGAAKEVTVHPRPDLRITPLDTLVCPPWLYMPQVTGEAAVLMWDYGDGSEQTSAVEHWYENDTDSVLHHRVVLHALSDKGCPEDFTGRMTVANLPVAGMRKEITRGRPQQVDLINLSLDYTECIWYLPAGRVEHTFTNRHLEFMENGQYVFSLVALNQFGCKDSTALEHEVLIKGLYFPNTFMPHSLNEKISRFNGIGIGLVRYKLELFDQYNNKIWETRALENGKPSEGWDGCNVKGERMPQGMYTWRAEAIFGDDEVWTGKNNESGVPETIQGTVLLLRE